MERRLSAILFVLVLLCTVLPTAAQQMAIDNFCQMKKGLLRGKSFETDKAQAMLDLYTSEKGFTFEVGDGKDVGVQEDDDKITLLLPNRTRFVTIRHPEYGELQWKVPAKVKALKKKKHYRADLITLSTKKEYKQQKQWAVFYIQPENAILYVDTTHQFVREGRAQVYLPLGKHSYKVEAPFYEPWTGTVTLTDSMRADEHIVLQSVYSYLTVKTPLTDCIILLDGQPIGRTEALSRRISAGRYRLTVVKGNVCYYNQWIDVQPTEKKVVDIAQSELAAMPLPPRMTATEVAALPVDADPVIGDPIRAQVHILAPDGETTILVNREPMGEGAWSGTLTQGFYAIQTSKDSLESAPYYLWIDSDREQTVNLAAPQSAYGMLNVESNEVDADIFINGVPSGRTPAVIRNLPAGRNYQVRLAKPGRKDIVQTVFVRGNEMNHLTLNMKTK